MDPAQPRQLEMFVDASELSAEAAEALRSIDFAQLLEQTANLSEHNNSLRQRNHINLYCLLAVALKIAITTIDDEASFGTFAADQYWRGRRLNRRNRWLSAVQFVLRPETTGEQKLASKYAAALRQFAEAGVTPERLPEAIRQTPGGLAAAASHRAKDRAAPPSELIAALQISSPTSSQPDIPEQQSSESRDRRLVSEPVAPPGGWELKLTGPVMIQLNSLQPSDSSARFFGTFVIQHNYITLIELHRFPTDRIRVIQVSARRRQMVQKIARPDDPCK
jgi:hypothetical protein